MNRASRGGWANAFHRSRVAPCLFFVPEPYDDRVLRLVEDLGLPEVVNGCQAWPLLDGAVCRQWEVGLPPMPAGVRILGMRPLRLLCHLLGFSQPRRLREESALPAVSDLLQELDAMKSRSDADLRAQATKALFRTSDEANWAARQLFGDRVMPPEDAGLSDEYLPATGAWGDCRFMRGEARALAAAGLTPEVALAMREKINHRRGPRGWASTDAILAEMQRISGRLPDEEAWDALRGVLVDMALGGSEREYFILEKEITATFQWSGSVPYVQFLIRAEGVIQAEAASNGYRDPQCRLSSEQEQTMVSLGWTSPDLDRFGSEPVNFRWWGGREDAAEMADLLIRTLRDVEGCRSPAELKVTDSAGRDWPALRLTGVCLSAAEPRYDS